MPTGKQWMGLSRNMPRPIAGDPCIYAEVNSDSIDAIYRLFVSLYLTSKPMDDAMNRTIHARSNKQTSFEQLSKVPCALLTRRILTQISPVDHITSLPPTINNSIVSHPMSA